MTIAEPVLIMAFNRPDHLSVLLDRLAEVQPATIYFAVDGPRPDKAGEKEKVAQVRELRSRITWTDDVHTLFQDTNHGCGQGVSNAITWFFDNVERGIILEDDIIPDPSFFPFCTELLDRYQDDDRVFAVSGCNVVPASAQSHPEQDYRFAQITHVWGWATWKRSWDLHTLDPTGWYRLISPWKLWNRSARSVSGAMFWASNFELTARGDIDTWDWQLQLANMAAGQLTATCNTNLVENIGFGQEATHTFEGDPLLMPLGSVQLPTRAIQVRVDRKADDWARKHHFRATALGTIDRVRKYAAIQWKARN
jgi:hypothetical protein